MTEAVSLSNALLFFGCNFFCHPLLALSDIEDLKAKLVGQLLFLQLNYIDFLNVHATYIESNNKKQKIYQ